MFSKLIAAAGLKVEDLRVDGAPVTSETDIAVAVREGKADVGLAIEAVAREQGARFLCLYGGRGSIWFSVVSTTSISHSRNFSALREPTYFETVLGYLGDMT